MKIIVTYTEAPNGDLPPFSVKVEGDLQADQLPRNHPDWVGWGIDKLEEAGLILPFEEAVVVEPTTEELREGAKALRDILIESPICVHGVVWQVDRVKDEPRINRAITTAKVANLPADYTEDWILADNTTRPTTCSELEQVIVAKATREGEIFAYYKQWLLNGMSEPFNPPTERRYYDVPS